MVSMDVSATFAALVSVAIAVGYRMMVFCVEASESSIRSGMSRTSSRELEMLRLSEDEEDGVSVNGSSMRGVKEFRYSMVSTRNFLTAVFQIV